MLCSTHCRWFVHPNTICWRAQIMQLLITQFCPASVTSCLLGPNIFLSTLSSSTISLCSSSNVRDQVSHPYKTRLENCTVWSRPILGLQKYFMDSTGDDISIVTKGITNTAMVSKAWMKFNVIAVSLFERRNREAWTAHNVFFDIARG
jgi:hypothetical protein